MHSAVYCFSNCSLFLSLASWQPWIDLLTAGSRLMFVFEIYFVKTFATVPFCLFDCRFVDLNANFADCCDHRRLWSRDTSDLLAPKFFHFFPFVISQMTSEFAHSSSKDMELSLVSTCLQSYR